MLGALLLLRMPTVSVLADSFYQKSNSAHAADITNWIASTPMNKLQIIWQLRISIHSS